MIQLDLPMPKHCGMCPCYDPHLRDCRAIMFIDREVNNDVSAIASVRPFWCPLNEPVKVESNVFDIVEEHHNCLVQILRNSVTNEISFGWKKETDLFGNPVADLGSPRCRDCKYYDGVGEFERCTKRDRVMWSGAGSCDKFEFKEESE